MLFPFVFTFIPGYLLLHDETNDFRLKELWEHVSPESVLTPREVYQMMQNEGYKVSFYSLSKKTTGVLTRSFLPNRLTMTESLLQMSKPQKTKILMLFLRG